MSIFRNVACEKDSPDQNRLLIKVALVSSSRAFMPETQAFFNFFESAQGFNPVIVDSYKQGLEAEALVIIVPYGLVPKWLGRPRILIADVPSRSLGSLRRVKDFIKAHLSLRPDLSIFLNTYVEKSGLAHGANLKIYRGMGYRSDLIVPRSNSAEIEAIYSGSLLRPGVLTEINSLAEQGLEIVVVGSPRVRNAHPNIEFRGKRSIKETYSLYSKATFGLNVMPVIEPYIYQDSTKLIEYCASGLKVITTAYPWALEFEKKCSAKFFHLSRESTLEQIRNFEYEIPDVSGWKWERVLGDCKLEESIKLLLKSQ